MKQCSGFTRDGGRCQRAVDGPNGWWYAHDPARAEAHSLSASKAGRSKGGASTGVSGVKAQLQAIIDRTL